MEEVVWNKWSLDIATDKSRFRILSFVWRKDYLLDIDPKETDEIANSLPKLACEREVNANFVQFQNRLNADFNSQYLSFQFPRFRHSRWLRNPFAAVLDGANWPH
ncbi:hypothetical protein HAX54_035285 [Datura stramonium]|uniref:Uncharacterized protein n=1 Tax=Datura stramonium TaxID=4076 RepID=A0ABS8RMK6_DATST|nr:hypothetical protein [Datura stramonium]